MVAGAATETQSSQRKGRGGTNQTGLKLSAHLSCHQDSVVRDAPVQHYRRQVGAATALGFDPSSYRGLDPSEQDANQPQEPKVKGNGTNLTRVATRFRADRDQLQEPSELIAANDTASNAGDLPSLLRKVVAPRLRNERMTVRDEELQQRQERDPENQDGDHRFGTSTLAVGIRASSGTLQNVYAHESGSHMTIR